MDEGSNPRVVVLFPGALGDLLLAMPAIAGIGARHGRARVTLVVSGWLCALAAASGVAHEVTSLDGADAVGLFGGSRLPSWMEGRPILYSWIGTRDADVAARLQSLGAESHLHAVVRGDGPQHAGIVYLEQAGFDAGAADFRWAPVGITPRARTLLAGARAPLLAVHPGAGSVVKRWALDGFHEVARCWLAAGGDVVEIVGPAERTLPSVPGAHRAADWSLVDVAALLARVDAFVGNDSGITHLAAAMEAPGIALFGPTDARRWRPLGDVIGTLESPSGMAVSALSPERVWRALAQRGCLDKLQGRT